MERCPCGSEKDYKQCCGPYLSGQADAPTAELLMRSRYTAYVKHHIDYIEQTHDLGERDEESREETRKWSENSTWLGLEILGTSKGSAEDDTGTVEFIAKYKQSGQIHEHHETSEFQKINGKWYFKEGKLYNATVVNAGPKISRNAPCPCGSGKKFKKCCG
ncbi:MAG: YchJ family protein [Spirochaetales bacterium]|nr:YchJ family protein [Spirochaetales bacterium]